MMVMLEQRRWKALVFLEEREQQRHLHCLYVLLRLDHCKFVQAPAAKLSGKTHKDSVVIVYTDAYPSDEDVCISKVKFFVFPLGSTLSFVLTTSRGPGIPCLLAFYHRDTRVVQKAKELEPRSFMDG